MFLISSLTQLISWLQGFPWQGLLNDIKSTSSGKQIVVDKGEEKGEAEKKQTISRFYGPASEGFKIFTNPEARALDSRKLSPNPLHKHMEGTNKNRQTQTCICNMGVESCSSSKSALDYDILQAS